jgi:hypothetical protein
VTSYDVTKPFRQVLLAPERLDAGLDDPGNWSSPGEDLAVVGLEPEALERRLGITFQDSWDDLGDVRVARLELPTGHQFTFLRHTESPAPGTTVVARAEDLGVADDLQQELLNALDLRPQDLAWQAPAVVDWPWAPAARS